MLSAHFRRAVRRPACADLLRRIRGRGFGTPFHVRAPSRDAVEMMQERARATGAELMLSLDESIPRCAKRFACTQILNALANFCGVHTWGKS